MTKPATFIFSFFIMLNIFAKEKYVLKFHFLNVHQ